MTNRTCGMLLILLAIVIIAFKLLITCGDPSCVDPECTNITDAILLLIIGVPAILHKNIKGV